MVVVALPNCHLITTVFDPIRPANVARSEGRRTERRIAYEAYWVAEWQADAIKLEQMGEIDAFLMKIEDGDYIEAYDTTRPRPMAYLSGQPGAFNGIGALTGLSARSLSLTGFPASYEFRVGDYIEVRQSTLVRSLHRVTANVTLGVGGTGVVPILHPINVQVFTTAATVHVEKASCLMQVDGRPSLGRRKGARRQIFGAVECFPDGG